VWFIDREINYNLPLLKVPLVLSKRITKKYLFNNKNVDLFFESKLKKESAIATRKTKLFINDKINPKITIANLNKLSKNCFDAIIVGSDQVWRPRHFMPIENAFLSFAKKWNIIRISYAASFGSDQWEYDCKQTRKCSKLLKQFDAVSSREDSGVKMCSKYFGVNSIQVLDPTMLLKKENYIDLIKKNQSPKSVGDLFIYMLDSDQQKLEMINIVAKNLNYIPFYSSTDSNFEPLEKRIATEVEIWIRSFYDAKYILTDSFHGCVFSILFNKPFIVFGNEIRGLSRFNSLLKMFDLEDRLIINNKDILDIIKKPIIWQKVNGILEDEKNKSIKFLINSLTSKQKIHV